MPFNDVLAVTIALHLVLLCIFKIVVQIIRLYS